MQGGRVHMKILVHLQATVHRPCTGVDEAAGVDFVYICPYCTVKSRSTLRSDDRPVNKSVQLLRGLFPESSKMKACVCCFQFLTFWRQIAFCFYCLYVEQGNLQRQEKVTLQIRGKLKSLGK